MFSSGKEDSANVGGMEVGTPGAELPSYSDAKADAKLDGGAPAAGDAKSVPRAAPHPGSPPPFSASTSSSARVEHVYSLNLTKGKPWLSLRMTSRAPSPKALPVFAEGDEISGTVEIDLEKPESSKGITIEVRIHPTSKLVCPSTSMHLSPVNS